MVLDLNLLRQKVTERCLFEQTAVNGEVWIRVWVVVVNKRGTQ